MKKVRILSLLSVTALVTTVLVTAPTVANAAPACDGKSPIQTCVGATSDGAPYAMQVPANFNGTVALYSHGYRYNVDIPAAIPLIGGYKITNTPEPVPGGNAEVAKYFFSQGIAIVGSGFARQGWNPDSAIKTNVELIDTFKKQFPKTTKVVAWGSSLGGVITQGLAEKHPELVSAVAPMCMADNIAPQLTMAGDFLWGVKVLFDPSIKGGNYSPGAAGVAESYADLGKVFTVMGKLQAGISTGAWPDTSSATGKALAAAGVPSRSALLLLGLMAGLPTQSAHFDSISGPEGALKLSFPLAVSPALAILENGTNAAALAVLATQDVEMQAGGAIFDNTKTDYAARIDAERVIFNAALSGNTVIDALLGALSPANPGAPRAVANPAAVAKMNSLHQNTGKINVPTILMVGIADPITPAGASQRLVDLYVEQYAAEKAAAVKAYKSSREYKNPTNKLLMLWNTTPEKGYTKFSDAGAPITSTPAAQGTNHCNFTSAQLVLVAKSLVQASNTGKLPTGGALYTAVRKAGSLSVDKGIRAPWLKSYGDN
ncbi:MAG: alpha/beta hydrolase [Candidatus Planktophila sp.]|nr:alpha/beta hydrolase [Candidatus Planktophila sp.]